MSLRSLRLCALSCAVALPAAAQFALPQGRGRISVGTFFVHQPLASYDVPRVIDSDTASTLARQFFNLISSDGSSSQAFIDAVGNRNFGLLSPGLSFSGSADALVNVFQVDYGITDHVTATVIWPYFDYAKTSVNLSAPNSLLAYNAAYDAGKPLSSSNFPVLYGSGKGVTGTRGVQLILQNVFGYRPFTSWQSYGTGDPVGAVSYTLDRGSWFLRATGLASVPLGQIADPDNPLMIPFGDGHVKVGARLWLEDVAPQPYTMIAGLNWQASFADHPNLRAYPFEQVPLSTASTEHRVRRVAGQHLTGVLGASRSFADGLLRVQFVGSLEHVYKDSISGPDGVDYTPVIANSTMNNYSAELSATISTVKKFRAGEFFLPAQITGSLRQQTADGGTFSGLAQSQAQLTVSTFF